MAKIIVVHASFGQGHRQAALAISSYLNAPCYDLLDFTFPLIKQIQSFTYLYVTQKMPFLWKFMFNISENKLISRLLNFLNLMTYLGFLNYLKKTQPEIVITTHFFVPHLISKIKKSKRPALISVVTDIKPHLQWASKTVDNFFAPSIQTKKWLIQLGIEAKKISEGYVSIREGFLEKNNKAELCRKFNLDPGKKTILFVSSETGNLKFLTLSLSQLLLNFNLIVIYGKNKKLKNHLASLKSNNLIFFKFYQKMWELTAISSVIVTKPGGLTVFEGGYQKKLFVFTHFIPGQEEENMNLLQSCGVAKAAFNPKELVGAINYLTAHETEIINNYPLDFKDIRKPLTQLIESTGNRLPPV